MDYYLATYMYSTGVAFGIATGTLNHSKIALSIVSISFMLLGLMVVLIKSYHKLETGGDD